MSLKPFVFTNVAQYRLLNGACLLFGNDAKALELSNINFL